MEPESDHSTTEYKRSLSGVSQSSPRFAGLGTQLLYRLCHTGHCTYQLGVEDDGRHSLRSWEDCRRSFEVLCGLAEEFGAVVMPVWKGDEEEVEEAGAAGPLSCLDEVTRRQVKDVRSRGGLVTWFNEEFPGVPGGDISDICRITVHVAQVDENKGRTRSMSRKVSETDLLADRSSPPSGDPVVSDSEEDLFGRKISGAMRIIVMGNVDAGKSTLVGSLTTDSRDDGRGSCRTKIMKHRHEITTGRTSTVSHHTMGYTDGGKVKTSSHRVRTLTDEEVVRGSERLITFSDLCGHEKYLKTTVYGMASGMGDYSLIVCNARHPPTHMTHHHLNLSSSNNIPSIIVLTKIDGCPVHSRKNTVKELKALLKRPDVNRVPFDCTTEADIDQCLDKLGRLSPIIYTSAVTGEGMDLLHYLLYRLPKRRRHEKKAARPFEFLVDDLFNVEGVGAVASGFVNSGKLQVASQVFVGPMDDGSFIKTIVKSMHIARTATATVMAGQSACLALGLSKIDRKKLRRGQVILASDAHGVREFDAEICVLRGDHTTIRRNYQSYAHILMVRQSVTARKISLIDPKTDEETASKTFGPVHPAASKDDDVLVLRPGARARVTFQFSKRPEFIRPGMRMIFRDGRVRGVGIIKECREHLSNMVVEG